MSFQFIPVQLLFDEWHKDPEYMKEYDALEVEFALASAVIGARACANLSQAELAERMNTSQSACRPPRKRPLASLHDDAVEAGGGDGDEAQDRAGAGEGSVRLGVK